MTYSKLFSPFIIGDMKLPNRVVLASLTRGRAGEQRLANEMMAKYYAMRADAGLLLAEATVVSKQAVGWPHTPGIFTDEQAEAWKLVTKAVHDRGGKIFLQLWHCGRSSHSDFQEGNALPVAPSAIKLEGDMVHTESGKKEYQVPRALETNEIPGIVNDFKQAAQRAKTAGFDGVEVHSANGYLLDEFLQSKTNHRSDIYGGSVENRFRIVKEVLEAVSTVYPSNRVGIKLSPNGAYNDMGSPDFRETFLYIANELNKFNLAYVQMADGSKFGTHKFTPLLTLAEFREKYKGVLMGNCGFDAERAEDSIEKGDVDLVSFGRPFIANPDLVERFKNNLALAPEAPMNVWYSEGAHGYTDFPTHADELAKV